jgi:ATP-dependent DNA helicase RecG
MWPDCQPVVNKNSRSAAKLSSGMAPHEGISYSDPIMRPEILFSLFTPVTTLAGVGPRIAKLIEKVAGERILDLFWHLPTGLIDRRFSPLIAEAMEGQIVTLTVTVGSHSKPHNRRQPYRVTCFDESGDISLVFFHAHTDYLEKTLPEGEVRVISGKIEFFNDTAQMNHPDHIVTVEDADSIKTVEPVFPLTAGLTTKTMGKAIRGALEHVPDLPEWINEPYRAARGWGDWKTSLMTAHHPESLLDMEPSTIARSRLAYDELLANQLALALVRKSLRRRPGRITRGDQRLQQKVRDSLPWPLTGAQDRSLAEVVADMAEPHRMLRLLQGDVGSGKTIVALLAMLNAVEEGRQAVMMAPTEILARQHYQSLKPMAEAAGVRMEVLTGRDKGKPREALLAELESGAIDILVGTHAVFQETVVFKDLAFAVIDEQHRFGVHQRLALSAKATEAAPDLLVMTATPIPRTLTLTAYGDMEVSRLDEKPPGRAPVDTRALPLERLDQVAEGVRRAVDDGARVYWVCPLVEESDLVDLAAAEERFAHLSGLMGDRVGLIHGRLKGPQKDAVMADFASGKLDVLVATTVIEVGVDVPEATVMVIEHAERFGLAQLHQLRGRIGRGNRPGTCLLLYVNPLSETAKARIEIMRETEDGFVIAEKDLELRGAGEVLGTKQSGLPAFHLADLSVHADLLAAARDDAKLILELEPDLDGKRGPALRVLLYLFERDAAVSYLRSG